MYGGWGSGGGWNMGDAKSSYEQYCLSHGRTPGGGTGGGGGGRGGRWTAGKVLGQLLLIVMLACLFKGVLMPVLAAGVAGALALVIYGIARLVSRGREK